ncbi:Rv3235 family protein [Streptomyces sp. NPDC058676]|uniref:Rv3235 family protein n=1 Tax=unclassified Streptomyces TaxID=2593676 RepID=UPI00364D0D49
MHKVMTRANHHPGARPPGRRDPRRPGGTPPRAPGGGTPRTTTPDGRPPGSPGTSGTPTHTSPTDNRPATAAPGPAPLAPSTSTSTGTRARTRTTAAPNLATTPTRPTRPDTAGRPPTAPTRPTTPSPTPGALGTPTTSAVPAQSPRSPLPQPRPTDVFADRLLAVLSGRRPVHWMLRHTAGRAYDELAWLAERGPLRATRGTLPVVRDIGYYVPRPGAIEAFARIGAGDQLRAMAFRLEQGLDLRWRCTAVELGGPRRPHTDDD